MTDRTSGPPVQASSVSTPYPSCSAGDEKDTLGPLIHLSPKQLPKNVPVRYDVESRVRWEWPARQRRRRRCK
jgi:hypothetical protein